jgi:hypothetical protein
MQEPANPQPKDVTIAPKRSDGTGLWLGRAANCVLLGLTFLWAIPGVPAKVVGAVIEIIAVLIIIRVIRIKRPNRNATAVTTPDSEPYANLQSAMTRLRETEDKRRAGWISLQRNLA